MREVSVKNNTSGKNKKNLFTSLTKPELALRKWNVLNFIEKTILETNLTREEYKVKLIALLAFKL